jgi:hypothetical protein
VSFSSIVSRQTHLAAFGLCSWLFVVAPTAAQEKASTAAPVASTVDSPTEKRSLRVYSAGHSFHVFVPGILGEIARSAGYHDHKVLGVSSIGGSRVIQHWEVANDKFKSKATLQSGEADVLTLSPIHLPDDGIEKFARLAHEHNPAVRVTIQEFWLPFDLYDVTFKQRPAKVDHNATTIEQLRALHAPYFKSMDDHVEALNKALGKQVLFVVPVGQAVIALREKIVAGQAPGIATQEDLFTDAIGHARPPIQALNAYCHYAVIYRRSPVGLPVPRVLVNTGDGETRSQLNRLLQQLAWDAVTQHPLSGVKASQSPER